MRVCFASYYGLGLWFACGMMQEGHSVDAVIMTDRETEDHFVSETLKGIFTGQRGDKWVTVEPKDYDLIVFDATHNGQAADRIRDEVPTIGTSTLATQLEDDRLFGLDFMKRCGLDVPTYEAFDDPADGIRYIKKRNKRLVFKPIGNIHDKTTTYVSKSPEDMLRFFDVLWRNPKIKQYVLQDYVEGIESATSAWVNASGYYAISHDTEVKKLMNGNLGPNTGCSGTLVWMPQRETRLFQKSLKKCLQPLAEMGYVGPIDLATICNDDGAWALEFCPRFTYQGTQLLTRLFPAGLGFADFLLAIASGRDVPEMQPQFPFCASVTLSIPPYPNDVSDRYYKETEGIPVDGITEKDLDKFYAWDLRRRDESDELEVAGISGLIGAPLAVGDTPAQAFEGAYQMLKHIQVPNAQYRTDICDESVKRYYQLRENGWLKQEYNAET